MPQSLGHKKKQRSLVKKVLEALCGLSSLIAEAALNCGHTHSTSTDASAKRHGGDCVDHPSRFHIEEGKGIIPDATGVRK